MANISDDDIANLNRTLSQLSGTMGSMAARMGAGEKGRKEAVDQILGDMKTRKQATENTKKLGDAARDTYQHLEIASRSVDDFGRQMEQAANKLPAGFLLAQAVNYTFETIKTYKELNKIGQTFGGSMIQMSMAAGAAGLPLNEFSKAMTGNSKVVATLGQGFFAINKDIRRAAEGMGLYGMSLEEMNNFSGSYLEQQRLTGALTRAGHQRQVKSINELAQSVSGVAKITGTARDEIMRVAEQAMRDSTVVAMMAGNTARGMHAYNDEINKAVTLLSAQAGPAGEFLGKGLAQTLAMGGAQFTEQADTMLQAGFSEGALALQQAADKLAAGMDGEQVQMELVNSLKAAADNPATREALMNQARAGNAQAREILAVTQNLKSYTRAEMAAAKADQKRRDMLTGFMSSFESIFSKLKGSLIEGFLSPFGDALSKTNFEDTLKNLETTFKPLEEIFKEMGKSWGDGLKRLLTGDNLKNFVHNLGEATKSFGMLMKVVFTKENMDLAMGTLRVVADIGLLVGGFTTSVLLPMLNGFVWTMNKLKEGLTGLFEFFKVPNGKTAASLITGGLVIAAGIAIKGFFANIIQRMMGLSSPMVRINAGQVVVNGAGGGGSGGGDFGGGEGGRRGGRQDAHVRARNRFMRGNRRGIRGVMGRAANLAEDIGTTASRQAGRFIPRGLRGAARGAGRFLGRAGLPVALGLSAFDQISMMGSLKDQLKNGEITKAEHDRQMAVGTGGNAGGLLGGLAAGAAAGAAGGALFGGVGAIPGAIIGGGIGAFAGSSAGQWVGGKWNDWRNRGRSPNDPQQTTAPNNPQTPQVDTQGQSDRMRDANRAAGQERTMEQLLTEFRKMNQTMDETRQINTAQLERQVEQIRATRSTNGAIEDGRR